MADFRAIGDGVIVEDDGTLVSTSVKVLDFGTNLTTTLNADGSLTVDASGGGGGGGSGDVVGPASATDNAVARYNGTTGKLIQNSVVTVSDTGAITGVASIAVSGNVDGRDLSVDGTKLDGIEALADVTDDANVRAALAAATAAVAFNNQNITTVGTVDGRDVSADGTALDAHIADGDPHSGHALTSTTITAGTGLTGGGDLSANRTLTVAYGTTASTATEGNDSRVTGAIQSSVLTTNGDLLTRAAGVPARLAIGTTGQRLRVSDGALDFGWPIDPRRETFFYEDFIGGAVSAMPVAVANFVVNSALTDANHTGILSGNSTSTTQSSISTAINHIFLGTETFVEWNILTPANLSDATDNYTVYCGTGDITAGGEHTDAISFRYNHAVNSGNWQAYSRNNSVETGSVVNSSVAFAVNTWVRLGFYLNAALDTVTFYVDGVSIGTTTANIPTGRGLGLMFKIDRTAGTASRVFAADYVMIWKAVTR